MQVSVLRPGFLISLKTTIRGGVSYSRRDIVAPHAEGESEVSQWETLRTVANAAEHAEAVEIRGRCRTLIVRHCAASSFGLLCPETDSAALGDGIAEAVALAADFNKRAQFSRVDVFALAGRIADNDLQAARAIGAEVRDLVAAMQAGIAAADPGAIREAANKARALSGMLSPEVAGQVSDAIAEARKAAREIVRRVEKAGEPAAVVVESIRLQALDQSRFAALDLDAAAAEVAEVVPAESRVLDLFADPAPAGSGDAAMPPPSGSGDARAIEFDMIEA